MNISRENNGLKTISRFFFSFEESIVTFFPYKMVYFDRIWTKCQFWMVWKVEVHCSRNFDEIVVVWYNQNPIRSLFRYFHTKVPLFRGFSHTKYSRGVSKIAENWTLFNLSFDISKLLAFTDFNYLDFCSSYRSNILQRRWHTNEKVFQILLE